MIRLTPLQRQHARRTLLLERHPDVRRWLKRPPATMAEIEARIDNADPDLAFFAIEQVPGPDAPRLFPETVGYLELRALRVPPVTCGSFELFVSPRHQGRGIGRQVVEGVPAAVSARWGMEAILIGVFEANVRAVGLYERLGYEAVDRQWFYPERGERRRWLMMSNAPDHFRRRRAGFDPR